VVSAADPHTVVNLSLLRKLNEKYILFKQETAAHRFILNTHIKAVRIRFTENDDFNATLITKLVYNF
jgi:hypothetical protein